MDFMKLLKSIEELLYELVTWFLFYPLTLWRIIVRPQQMLTYAEKELTDKEADQFYDSLSPPIMLLLTLVLLHALGGALGGHDRSSLPGFLADDRNLLVFRTVAFSLIPLFFAVARLRLRGARLARAILKPAFYSQGYAAIPLIIAISLGLLFVLRGGWSLAFGIAGLLAALVWFIATQTLFLARSANVTLGRSFAVTIVTLLLALFAFIAAALLTELAASGRYLGNLTGT